LPYIINPTEYLSMFAVPAAVTDKHLKLAGALSLKVLLLLCRSGANGISVDEIAAHLNVKTEDVRDALGYWLSADIVLDSEASVIQSAKAPEPASSSAAKPPKKAVGILRPSREEVALRGKENKEIAILLNQAQQRLGRMLRANESSTLVGLYDDEGMPVAVILMMLEHLSGRSRATVSAIEAMAADWNKRGITTVEKAENEIKAWFAKKQCWYIVAKTMGLGDRQPSERERGYAARWIDEWDIKTELLRAAYDICIDKKARIDMSYIDGILKKWHRDGIVDIQTLKVDITRKKTDKQKNSTSYDLKKMEDLLEW